MSSLPATRTTTATAGGKEKARINAAIAAQQAAAEALRLEAQAPLFIEHVRQDLQEQLGLPAPAQQLALPAPTPALTIQISLFTELQPEPLPVSTGSRNSTHA